jgi:chemotaxis family two-component system response regulator Rcp1
MQPIEILLVEDNPGDVRLTREALHESKVHNNLHVARDGIEAMAYLRNGNVLPDIILLDLNMPRMSGHEVLREIKQDPDLAKIPVVVLTTSQDETDIEMAYALHANCYINKPVDMDQFVKIVKTIENFWFSIVKLPHTHD